MDRAEEKTRWLPNHILLLHTKCSALFKRNLHIRCIFFSCIFFELLTGHVYLHTLYKYLSTKTVTTTVTFSYFSIQNCHSVTSKYLMDLCVYHCANLCEFNWSFSDAKSMFFVVYVFCIWCVKSLRKPSMEHYTLTHLWAYWTFTLATWRANVLAICNIVVCVWFLHDKLPSFLSSQCNWNLN